MATDHVLTNALLFRWDEGSRQLLVLDASSTNSGSTIAKVDFVTLDKMSWPDASKFIGEFVTLLVPTLRSRYESEFADAKDHPDDNDA